MSLLPLPDAQRNWREGFCMMPRFHAGYVDGRNTLLRRLVLDVRAARATWSPHGLREVNTLVWGDYF